MGVTLNFDSTNVEPAKPLDPVPSGWYTCAITASEMKPTDKPGGMYLELEETVIEPAEYAGRKVYDRLNLQNANPVAVEIAYKQLSAICHAVGVIQVADSSQLHNRPLMVKVSHRAAGTNPTNGQAYDANNEVKGYKAAGAHGATSAPQPPAVTPPPVPPAPATAAPWQAPAAIPATPAAPPPAWQPPAAAPVAPVALTAPTWTPPAAQPLTTAAPVAPASTPAAAAAAPAAPPWAALATTAVAPAAPPWAQPPK